MAITIRSVSTDDAEAFLELCRCLDHETTFMMLEPGERTMSVETQERVLRSFLESSTSQLLVAVDGTTLVGFASARGGDCRRGAHKGHVVIGLLQRYTGQGIGALLLEGLEARAREAGLHRLELTVMSHNERAIALYRKRGFSVEGTLRDSLSVDGNYVDELMMGKLLAR